MARQAASQPVSKLQLPSRGSLTDSLCVSLPVPACQVVDMGNLLVHLVDGQARQALRLEEHWADPERLVDLIAAGSGEGGGGLARARGQKGGKGGRRSKGDEAAAEARIDAVVAANPVPEEYNAWEAPREEED